MSSKDKVLILEDDQTILESLKATLTRAGFTVLATTRHDDAMDYLRKNEITTFFVDCLLPGVSGVDFVVKEVRPLFNASKLDVVMMSGLFTDAAFVKETLRSTQAISFLKKPFELEEVIALVKPKQTEKKKTIAEVHPRRNLYRLLAKAKVSSREKRKTIEALDEIHGFDLPFIYALLTETQATGHLNMTTKVGEVLGVSFSQGKIIGVDILDQDTQIGKLLVESGYLHPDDLEMILSTRGNRPKIGQRLIEGNLLSPHAFNIALANQMKIRLSRTIADTTLKVNFVGTDLELTSPHLDSVLLSSYFHDWITAKLSVEWLRNHFIQFGHAKILFSPNFTEENEVFQLPIFSHIPEFIEKVKFHLSVDKFLEASGEKESQYLKALHLLLIKGLVSFEDGTDRLSPTEMMSLLKKIDLQIQGKQGLAVLSVLSQMVGTLDSDPQSTIYEFQKQFADINRPEYAESSPIFQSIMRKCEGVANQISEQGREALFQEAARDELEMKLKATAAFDEAKAFLQKSNFSQALLQLKKVYAVDPKFEKLKLYMAWVQLASIEGKKNKNQVIAEVEANLMEVPPEEKFDSIYHYVTGLYFKAKGDFHNAKKAVDKSLALDSAFLPARREATVLDSLMQKNDVFHGDLTTIIGGLFKKR